MCAVENLNFLSIARKEVGKRVRSYTRDYLLWCSGYEVSQMFPPELAAQIDAFPDVIKPYGHSVTLDPQDLFSPEKTTRSRKEVARRREVFFDLNGVQIGDPAFGLNEVHRWPRPNACSVVIHDLFIVGKRSLGQRTRRATRTASEDPASPRLSSRVRVRRPRLCRETSEGQTLSLGSLVR